MSRKVRWIARGTICRRTRWFDFQWAS